MLCVTLDHLLRRHCGIRGKEILVTVSSCAIMDLAPSDLDERFPDTVPVPRARDDLNASGAFPIPRHREAGARGRARHDLLRGCEFLAFHTRASYGAARARGRRLIQGGIAIKFTHQSQVATVLTATPGGLAGAVAGVTHKDEVPMRKPPY